MPLLFPSAPGIPGATLNLLLCSPPGAGVFTSSANLGGENACGRASRGCQHLWSHQGDSAALWGSHRLYKRMQRYTSRMMPQKSESVHRQLTEQSPEFTSDTNSSLTWGAVRPQNSCDSLPPRAKPRAGKQIQSSRDNPHTPSLPSVHTLKESL